MPKIIKRLISIVIPVFNEVENLSPFLTALNTVTHSHKDNYDFEFVFTDNHSTDGTFELLAELAKSESRIRVIRFSRNFGYQKSILTGYLNTRGDAAIQLDVDLQDPPALISDFLKLWEEGYSVVYGIRENRQEGVLINSTRKIFYKIISCLSESDVPRDAGDFRLIDRRIIDLLGKIRDQNPYIRGKIAGMGFKQIGIPYDRNSRAAGHSKFSLGQYFKLAIDGIVSQSIVPLRIASYTGIFVAFVMVVAIGILIMTHWIFGAEWPRGFALMTLLILFGISLNALFLGIIGEYIARIYRQSIAEPLTILEKTFPENLEVIATDWNTRDQKK